LLRDDVTKLLGQNDSTYAAHLSRDSTWRRYLLPPKVVAPCAGEWALQCSACKNRNDHQPSGSSYVSDRALF